MTATAQFLKEWYQGHPFTLTAIAADGGKPTGENFTDPNAASVWAQQMNAAGHNVYFHVNPGINTHVSEKTGRLSGKLSKTELTALHAVHVDIDPPANVGPNEADQWRAQTIADLGRRGAPTHIVCSGRGLAAYWKFNAPVDVSSLDRIEQMNRGLVAMFNGDRAAVDASRIMKLPGTIAHLNADKRAAGWQQAPAGLVQGVQGGTFDPVTLEGWVTANAPVVSMPTPTSGDISEELPEGPSPRWSGPSDDDELIAVMRRHYDALKPGLQAYEFFMDMGDTPSENFRNKARAAHPNAESNKQAPWDFPGSETDQTLINHLSYYTGGDAARIKRLFTRSIMGKRPKVAGGHRDDYVQRTIWKVKREFDANPNPSMLGKDKPSLDSLQRRFLAHPDDLSVLSEVAKLPPAERDAFVEEAHKGDPNHTKAELNKLVKEAVVEARKLATAERGLVFDAKGNPVQNLENVRRILLNDPKWKGVFQYSSFRDRIVITRQIPGDLRFGIEYPCDYRDVDALVVMSWFQSNEFTVIGDKTIRSAILTAAVANSFHEVRDFLNSLSWDGISRLGALFTHYFPCDVESEIPGYLEYLQMAGQRFCIGAVARIMNPGCKLDHMPVISGPQGMSKSTGVERLFGKDFGGSDIPEVTSKDAKEWLPGNWFAEFAELSSLNGRDVNHIKNFMSTSVDKYRKSYGHVSEHIPRQIVFFGTVNGDEYLMDETGNRRFWPMRVSRPVDLALIDRDRVQLWAEAVALYATGHQWWFDQGECAALERAQDDARVMDVDETRVREWLGMQRGEVTALQVLMALFPDKDGNRSNSMKIARYLKACGWETSRNTAGQRWWGRTDKAEPYSVGSGTDNVVQLHQPVGMTPPGVTQ